MKKRNFQSLQLNKKLVYNLTTSQIVGGYQTGGASCTNPSCRADPHSIKDCQ